MCTSERNINPNICAARAAWCCSQSRPSAKAYSAFGLIVGIPAYLFFNYFSSAINSFVLQVESTAAELIEVVTVRLTLDRSEESDSGEKKPRRRRSAPKKSEE